MRNVVLTLWANQQELLRRCPTKDFLSDNGQNQTNKVINNLPTPSKMPSKLLWAAMNTVWSLWLLHETEAQKAEPSRHQRSSKVTVCSDHTTDVVHNSGAQLVHKPLLNLRCVVVLYDRKIMIVAVLSCNSRTYDNPRSDNNCQNICFWSMVRPFPDLMVKEQGCAEAAFGLCTCKVWKYTGLLMFLRMWWRMLYGSWRSSACNGLLLYFWYCGIGEIALR
jgi:hypothetical protein